MPYKNLDELLHERHTWKEESVRQLEQKEDLFVTENPNLMSLSFKELTDFQTAKQSQLDADLEELRSFHSMAVSPVLHNDFLPKKSITGDRAYLSQNDAVSFANLKDVYDYFVGYTSKIATYVAKSHGFTSKHASTSINHISEKCSTCIQIIETHCLRHEIPEETKDMALTKLPDLSGLIHLQGSAHYQIRLAFKQFNILNLLLDNLLFSAPEYRAFDSQLAESKSQKLEIREAHIVFYEFNIHKIRNFDLKLFNLLITLMDTSKQIVFLNMLKYKIFDIEGMRKDYDEYKAAMAQSLLLIGVENTELKVFNTSLPFFYQHSKFPLSEYASKHMIEHHELYSHALFVALSGNLQKMTCSYHEKYQKQLTS